MIINNLEKAVNNLLQGWLGASEGVSVFVKQRHAFDNALKIALIERFYMMGFEDVLWSIQDKLEMSIDTYHINHSINKFYKGFSEYVN